MGHSEMLLAVAGLSEDDIKHRTEQLATGDWSHFPPAERQALMFAQKLTSQPGTVTSEDIAALKETFGDPRAVDLIWYVSWCNYMTRVADALQLPLETENVFEEPEENAIENPDEASDTADDQ